MEHSLLMSVLLLILTLARVGVTQMPGSMQGIDSGSITLSANDLSSVSSKAYTIILARNLGADPLGCALALAGYQTMNQGTTATYAVLVTSNTFTNNNTIMNLVVSFKDTQRGITNTTVWLKLKWTYLIISSTFDGKYTNIWTTFAEFDPQNINNSPVHSQGLTFVAMGGITADCDIYMDPLMQVDLQNCKPRPVNGQYEGGKIIIHAYITGFSQRGNSNQISVSKGSSQDQKSDSTGWQIVYSTTYPNGPKISVASSNVTWLQVSFLYVRMNYYAKGYPLNSQLKYSSSHIYTSAESYNSKVQLKNNGIGQFNENYFPLPEYTYSIYGFSSLKFGSDSSGIFYLQMNLDSLLNAYQIRSSITSHESIVSADLFVKNVMDFCSWRQKSIQLQGKSNQIKINPNSNIVSAVDVTNSVPLSQITHSKYPLVFKYALASSTLQAQITFVSTFLFSGSKPNDNLRIELRWFQNLNYGSLIDQQSYRLKVTANGVLILDQIYQHSNQIVSYLSPTYYRSIVSQSDTVLIQSTVTYSSSTSSQEFYLLVALRAETTVYNPYTQQCSLQCPFGFGIEAQSFPLTCLQCDIRNSRTYSVKNNSCTCPQGTYLSGAKCQPCGQKCAQCDPADPETCYSCKGSVKLMGGVCDDSNCPTGTVSVLTYNISQCIPCQYPCLTCRKNPYFCITCPANFYLYSECEQNQTCLNVCPLGTLLQEFTCKNCYEHCKICASRVENCVQCKQPYALYRGTCTLTCPGIAWPTSEGKICLSRCPDGLFSNGSSACLPCAPNCLTCNLLAFNCTSCRTGVLVDFGVCINQCETNQYISGGVCLNCSYPCAKCFRAKDYCVGCIQGMIVKEGKCVKQCQVGQFYQDQKMSCLQCGRGCATCSNQTHCLTCLNSTYIPQSGLCPFCEASCRICGPDNRCLVCEDGLNLFNGACVSSCPSSTLAVAGFCACRSGVLQDGNCTSSCLSGFYALQGTCFACSASCRQCSSSQKCTRCFSGYKLQQHRCLQINVCHYGQYFRSGKCIRLCDQGWYFFEGNCFFGRCPDGFVPNLYGGCDRQWFYQCPSATYHKQGKCVSTCGTGFWQTDFYKCSSCPSNCDRCLNSHQCLICSNGYSNIDGRCYYSGCANDTLAVGSNCTLNCPAGTKQSNKVCVQRCPQQSYFSDPFCYYTCPSAKHDQYTCVN